MEGGIRADGSAQFVGPARAAYRQPEGKGSAIRARHTYDINHAGSSERAQCRHGTERCGAPFNPGTRFVADSMPRCSMPPPRRVTCGHVDDVFAAGRPVLHQFLARQRDDDELLSGTPPSPPPARVTQRPLK